VTQAGGWAVTNIGDGYFLGSNAGNFKAGVAFSHWLEIGVEEAVAKRAGVGFAGFDANAGHDITGRDLDPRRCLGGRNVPNYVGTGVACWWRIRTVGIRFGITA
jgi:hypothetical protein